MATFFIDYQQLILDAYERKKKENTLPYGLKYLTPAKLKDECEMRCANTLSRRDQKIVRDFCGNWEESKSMLAVVKNCERDKFRPLVYFLQGKSGKPDEKYIELLAWLIDFPDRPFDGTKKYSSEYVTSPETNEPEPAGDTAIVESHFTTEQPSNTLASQVEKPKIPEIPMAQMGTSGAENSPAGKEKSKGKSTKRLAVAAILSLALGTSGMWLWKETSQPMDLSGGCMIWREDHYEPIACGEKEEGALIIGLDSVKLKNFRKITTPDTITYRALGKVWYSKIDGKIEFFTSEGLHPVNINRKLKPLSTYMIDKYILSGTASN